MAFTFNGFGTRFYGERDYRADGSFITTEWIVLAYLPILPLRSLRVIKRGRGDYNPMVPPIVMGSSVNYGVLEKTKPNWKQVLMVYAFVGLFVAWVAALIYFLEHWRKGPSAETLDSRSASDYVLDWGCVFVGALPFLVPPLLRARAQRNIAVQAGASTRVVTAPV